METILFAGFFDLSWWQLVIAALGMTHITIVGVTVFLHRAQTHRALDLHPAVSHFFRLWLWLTTGMATREWVAIHRKHHAKCETVDDPHSPQVLGIKRVLWGGVFLYVKESGKRETIERYGHGTPDDWLERNVYSKYVLLGLTLMGLFDVLMFGIVPGVLILVTQIAWIPFWAAGVINGVGHFWGYRSFPVADASVNIAPWGILIGGEELHNNHHAFPSSARLSNKWYEFDIGWMYIRILESLGLARVKRVAPVARFCQAKTVVDLATLQAVIANRYEVLADFAASMRATCKSAFEEIKRGPPVEPQAQALLGRWLKHNEVALSGPERQLLEGLVARSPRLLAVVTMRRELSALWERSAASKEQLVAQMQNWCQRAEASGVAPLERFSRRLRCYA